jgi:hypothetical protein
MLHRVMLQVAALVHCTNTRYVRHHRRGIACNSPLKAIVIVFFFLLVAQFAVDDLEHVVRQDCLLCRHGSWQALGPEAQRKRDDGSLNLQRAHVENSCLFWELCGLTRGACLATCMDLQCFAVDTGRLRESLMLDYKHN